MKTILTGFQAMSPSLITHTSRSGSSVSANHIHPAAILTNDTTSICTPEFCLDVISYLHSLAVSAIL